MGESLMPIEIHLEKRVINNNVVREADAKSHRDYIVVTALGAVFLFGLFAYGWQHYQWIQYGYRIEEIQKKKDQLAEIGRQLRLEGAPPPSAPPLRSIPPGGTWEVVDA